MKLISGKIQDANRIATECGRQLTAVAFSCNSSVRRDKGQPSSAVLGVGTGRWASRQFAGLAKALGQAIVHAHPSRRVWVLRPTGTEVSLIAVRTKGAWHEASTMEQLSDALDQLVSTVDQRWADGEPAIVVPIFGTGSGKLPQAKVVKMMKRKLDNRFIAVFYDTTIAEIPIEF